jgi:hypothetical protein
LNIDPPAAGILKICGIASGFAFGYDPTGRSVFSIKKVSGVSPAAGQKNGRSNRKRN